MEKRSAIGFRGDFINGRFVLPKEGDGEFVDQSPADTKDEIMRVRFKYAHVDEACDVAHKAHKTWSRFPLDERKEYLNKLKTVYESSKREIAEVISRDTGKPLWEANSEVDAMISKITITINHSLPLVAEQHVENALPGVDGYIRFKPRGPLAVLGPFNFPGHLPNGHIIPALLTGNTIVFKPSEMAPAVGQMMAECFEKAEFPFGVFNLVQGNGEVGRRLVKNELIEGILFTGSYDVGLKIKQETINHFWKILALEMGGKNASIVWDDVDFEKTVYENVVGAFLTTGQRCSCTSRLIVHRKIRDRFVDKFYNMAKKLKIGHWNENPFMGPLINKTAVEKFIRFQEIAKRENCESLMRGKALKLKWDGYYVTPSINIVDRFDPQSIYQKTEIFGPNVAIYTVDDFDEAIEIVNGSSYGLVMSLFSKDRKLYEEALARARVGLVNWNRTTNGASSRLPFGGMGKSGNDRPSAHFAVYYCTVPVACLEDKTSFDPNKIFPGVDVLDN